MLRRLLHSIAMFAAIVVAYQVYVLAAVPWIEPPPLVVKGPMETPAKVEGGSVSVTKYQRILAAYFPPDHWSQTRPPKVIENETGSVMFVLDDYKRHDDGRVDLTHFALLIFPTPRQQSVTPPRDAIILEAPQGAHLQFDKNFHPERGEIGEIQLGEFPGPITIRSDMRDPGPEDDLLVETSDLRMNSKLMYTNSPVRFRLGPNVGGGRELEIRLLEVETAKARAGLNIASVDSLEIRKDVRLRVFLNSDSLLPGDTPETKKPPAPAAQFGDPSKPPVEVTCTGPFRFDFIKYIASFDENVEAWQVNPQGPSDQLSCSQLDLYFARKLNSTAPPERSTLDTASRQRADIRWLEPDRIVAMGYPVVIVSPSRQAEVRGNRVQLLLRQRKVAVDGGQDVAVAFGPNLLRAPQIQYQHPAADAGTKIGTFRATGPGILHYVLDPNKPDVAFQAEWQASVELGRHNGQPVLTVAGRPKLAVTNMGLLSADQIRVFFREVEADGKTQPLPDRLNAVGQVEIDSPELLAETRELSANFHVEQEIVPGAGGSQSSSNGLAPFNMGRSTGPAQRTYKVQSDAMHLDVALRGRRAAPTRLTCDGNVSFRELPSAQLSDDDTFQVGGDQLTADQLDTATHVTIRGAAPDQSQPLAEAALAEIRARGMTVHAAEVHLDVGKNRLWIDGPGVANMVLKRSLTGHANATPTSLDMQWQGGLNFDGRTIVIRRNIQVTGPDDRVQCDELAARLSSTVEFGKRVDQNAIDVAEVECRGRVVLDHTTRDEVDVTSHERLELARLAVNQQTGAISGDGPGVIRSTHFADQLNALTVPGAAAANSLPADNAKLHFLRVAFQEGMTGNFIDREITFLTRVRTVYGPVDSWEQELDVNRPELLPPETITLTSDRLRVNEDSLSASRPPQPAGLGKTPLGPVQFQANGNVRIDGQSPRQGMFAATAERASYEQVKELFILEGSNRVPATLWHRDPLSGQQIENSAGKIMYNRQSGQAVFDVVRSIEFTPGAGPRRIAEKRTRTGCHAAIERFFGAVGLQSSFADVAKLQHSSPQNQGLRSNPFARRKLGFNAGRFEHVAATRRERFLGAITRQAICRRVSFHGNHPAGENPVWCRHCMPRLWPTASPPPHRARRSGLAVGMHPLPHALRGCRRAGNLTHAFPASPAGHEPLRH